MPIQAKSADGVIHSFPDGTDMAVVDRVMKQYAMDQTPQERPGEALLPSQIGSTTATQTPFSPYAYAGADPNISMHDIGQVAVGGAGGVGSIPSLVEGAGRKAINLMGAEGQRRGGIEEPEPLVSEKTVTPTAGQIEESLAGPPADQRDVGYRALGNVASAALPLPGPALARGALEAPGAVARTVGRVLPGATARATDRLVRIGLPEGQAELGTRMADALKANVTKLATTRRTAAESNVAAYKANRAANAPALEDYRSYVDDLLKDPEGNLSKEEKALLLSTRERTKGPISFEALDKERRRINGIGNMPKGQEGFDAIRSTLAKNVGKKLGEIMSEKNEAFGKYLSGYASASEPLNQFKSLVGKAGNLNSVHTLPTRIFSSGKNYSTFKDLAPDPAFAEASARIYAASGLEKATSGKNIGAAANNAQTWLRKNEDWLKQEPALDKTVRDYVGNLKATANTRHAVYTASGIGAAILMATEGSRAYYWIRHLLFAGG